MEEYLGTAHNVEDLLSLLSKVPKNATVTASFVDGYSYSGTVEVWLNKDYNDVVLK